MQRRESLGVGSFEGPFLGSDPDLKAEPWIARVVEPRTQLYGAIALQRAQLGSLQKSAGAGQTAQGKICSRQTEVTTAQDGRGRRAFNTSAPSRKIKRLGSPWPMPSRSTCSYKSPSAERPTRKHASPPCKTRRASNCEPGSRQQKSYKQRCCVPHGEACSREDEPQRSLETNPISLTISLRFAQPALTRREPSEQSAGNETAVACLQATADWPLQSILPSHGVCAASELHVCCGQKISPADLNKSAPRDSYLSVWGAAHQQLEHIQVDVTRRWHGRDNKQPSLPRINVLASSPGQKANITKRLFTSGMLYTRIPAKLGTMPMEYHKAKASNEYSPNPPLINTASYHPPVKMHQSHPQRPESPMSISP